MIKNTINKLPQKYKWTIHNLVAHPLMEFLHIIGYSELGNKLHDITVPSDQQEETLG